MIKRLFPIILISAFFLNGCDAPVSEHTSAEKEPNMIFNPEPENYVIFSPMEGILLKDGEPLANTKIIRRLTWNDNDDGLVEEFYSDQDGHFSLPIHEENLAISSLSQFVASASLEVSYNGESQDIWYNNRFENGLFAESNGPLKKLVCALEAEEIVVKAGYSRILTKCRWADMPESQD